MATAETHYGPGMLSALQSIADQGACPEGLKVSARGLHRIAFWLDFTGNRWRIEVAELLSTGMNEWGFLTNHAMRENRPLEPVLVETCDGSTVTHWDISFGRAKTRQFDPSLPRGGGYVCAKLAEYVLLGQARRAAGYSSAGRDKVGEIDCYRLVHRAAGKQYDGKVELWVAPEIGFAPVNLVALSVYADEPRRGSRTETTHTSFTQLADDIWFPRKTTTNRYSYVPEKDDAMCETSILRFSHLRANAPIAEFRFHTQLPPGVLVRQMELDETTLIGNTQAVRKQFLSTPTAPQYDEGYRRALRGDELESAH